MTALWADDADVADGDVADGDVADREVWAAVRPLRRLAARAVTVRRGGRELLHAVDTEVAAGEVVAIAGPSGAGKTTLLRVLAGLDQPAEGSVVHSRGARARSPIGFVPQDDIVHTELTVGSTLRYAAALRMPPGSSRPDRERAVDDLVDRLGLAEHAEVRVGDLSGGQRKRVSIAVELIGEPEVLLLDEPTSGLDPATAADVIALLRRLAAGGVAVALTTHSEADIEGCDRVVFLSLGGRLAFDGTPTDALDQLGAAEVADIYRQLATDRVRPMEPVAANPLAAVSRPPRPVPLAAVPAPDEGRRSRRVWRQVAVLTRRNAEVMLHNRLTLAVLLGSPLLVTAMMATLFRPGAFGADEGGGLGPVQVTFWLAFAGFFFGLTYGLLQVVVERPVLERERFAGVHLISYLVSKVLVLAPLLTVFAAVLLGTLRVLDRLPGFGWSTMGVLLVTLVLESLSALALGLLASSAVRDPAQATLALPMLCFPQVLFAGAVVPVVAMTGPGAAISALLANRWGFESLGRSLALDELAALPGVGAHGSAFAGSPLAGWVWLAASTVVLLVATAAVLRRTTPAPARLG